MSVDVKALKSHGITSGQYRKIFTAPKEKRPARVNKLIDLIAERFRSGREQKISDYKLYWAIDLACEEPLNQVTPTLIKNFLSHKWKDADEMFGALDKWGLIESDLFMDVSLPDGNKAKMINPPVLFKTVIPIVQAYLKARLSKIFNDRNQSPLLPYNPLKASTLNEVICEIVTDLINTVSTWYGYPMVLHDSIQQMLKYGVSLSFPREEWHCEQQVEIQDGVEKVVTVKEGLRYIFPHPTRMFWDLMHPLHTINSDTGCEFSAHWNIVRYGDVLDNRDYWNRKNISYGSNWFEQPMAQNYFQEVFPCRLQFPKLESGSMHREDRAAFYATGDREKAVFLGEMFMRITPSDWGLGEYEDKDLKKLVKTYDYPVWHRFTMAGDSTIIWAEPCAYVPSWFMGYDYDPNAARNSSMPLETMSAQDDIGNLYEQMMLTSAQNLAKVIFYDTNWVDKSDIERLRTKGHKIMTEMTFIGYDSAKTMRAGIGNTPDGKAFQSVDFGYKDINQMLQMVTTRLNLLERTLQITAQETGSAASHQQSKAEIIQTGGASSNRLSYTASFVDEGVDAWKRQIFTAYKAYGDAGISAQVSADIPDVETHLNEIGFTIKSRNDQKVIVNGTKHKLRLEAFARANEGPQLAESKEQSQVIFQTMGTIAAQPQLVQQIGVKNILQTLEFAARLGGAPRGFKLRVDTNAQDDQIPEVIQKAIAAAQSATMSAIESKLAQPIAAEMTSDRQKIEALSQAIDQLKPIAQAAAAAQDKLAIKKAESDQKISERERAFEAEQKRKDAETLATIQREFQKMRAEIEIRLSEAKVDHSIKVSESAAKTDSQTEAAAAS